MMIQRKLIDYLSGFVTPHRVETIEKILQQRTRYITIVLEDLFQAQNASAVLRTCDCFGIQDVHIIENRNKFKVNPEIAMGASKWLNLFQYNQQDANNTLEVIKALKQKGYRIVATAPEAKGIKLEEFDLSKGKIALFFGTELQGLTEDVFINADEFLTIPIVGFTESFNISVSAGIILHHLSSQLRKSGINWALTEDEIQELKIEWLKNSLKDADLIEKQFYRSLPLRNDL